MGSGHLGLRNAKTLLEEEIFKKQANTNPQKQLTECSGKNTVAKHEGPRCSLCSHLVMDRCPRWWTGVPGEFKLAR